MKSLARKQTARTAATDRNPARASKQDGGKTPTVADAIRRWHWIAGDINAREFALFFASSSLERSPLVPCFDSHYPDMSPATRRLLNCEGDEFVKHKRVSTLPCWWGDETDTLSHASFSRFTMANRIAEWMAGLPGIVFPVFCERGTGGLVFFLGREIRMSEQQCLDVHARCFALFQAVATVHSNDPRKLPAMSKRELECLKLTANGMTSEQIAAALKLSVHTANQYLTNSTQKLEAANRTHAVARALKLGLIT